jgi:hypothetical protein
MVRPRYLTESRAARTGDGALERQHIRLGLQDLRALLDDVERLLLAQAALTVEMILEKGDVGLCRVAGGEKLLWSRYRRRGRLHLRETASAAMAGDFGIVSNAECGSRRRLELRSQRPQTRRPGARG